ncbi:DNA repair protein RecN [Abyssicoccus albus]|uniref:DNA repair protein RecN n=1 Tax=Abyssicoccus albus TaxID=1817405 RepID=UPI00097E3598|nr:DNA repair protein RecN [Abyssicoccus albus]AQL56113.1 DNA repair protein RecN [Abyssicoccus albus]
MLTSIRISNVAIINEQTIDFSNGLTVLTGETGAGKSLIIQAISLISGQRAQSSIVKKNSGKATIEAVFDLDDRQDIIELLEKHDIELDDFIVVERVIYKNGKSLAKINHKVVSLKVLKTITTRFIQVFAQHEAYESLLKFHHHELLDEHIDETLLNEYEKCYDEYLKNKKNYESFNESIQSDQERIDLLKFQLEELYNIDIQKKEDIELQQKIDYMTTFEERLKLYEQTRMLLDDEGLQNKVIQLDQLLNSMISLDNNQNEQSTENKHNLTHPHSITTEFNYALDDIRSYVNDDSMIEYDNEQLNDWNLRLSEIERIKNKHQKTIDELHVMQSEYETELYDLEHQQISIEDVKKLYDESYHQLIEVGKKVTDKRKDIAIMIEKQVKNYLEELEMKDAEINFDFAEEQINRYGIHQVNLFIKTNKGEDFKPIHQVASGGEISRIQLALKQVSGLEQHDSLFVYDEIDTGVSGPVAHKIAKQLKFLSNKNQVISISHLPQMAALADQHLYVEKYTDQSNTHSKSSYLNNAQRINEIARMISGDSITEEAKSTAKSLLSSSQVMN